MNRTEQCWKVKKTRVYVSPLLRAAGLFMLLCLNIGLAGAQTSTFTYQGQLSDGGSPANGQYDLQFKLFDALTGGTQIGSTFTVNDLTVTGGVFSLTLDFGGTLAFTGLPRFLEISVRPGASTGAYTTLTPRQQVTSAPYAIRSLKAALADNATAADGLSAACTGCVTSSQIGSLPSGNSNYVQNTTSAQSNANFNISGNGTAGGTLSANVVNAAAQYSLGGTPILSAGGAQNLFAGAGAGQLNTGGNNAFFGFNAGASNTSGGNNSFFGRNAGAGNTTGGSNAFFGFSAGGLNSGGSNNAFFGINAGSNNTTGGNNTAVGAGANVASGTLSFATAIGAGAAVSTSNTVVLGRNLDTVSVPGNFAVAGALSTNIVDVATQFNIAGNRILSMPGTDNLFTGIGAGGANTTGRGNAFFGRDAGKSNTTGDTNAFFGVSAGKSNSAGDGNSFFGADAGFANTTGASNAFFGVQAGAGNTAGRYNSIVGFQSGIQNTTGEFNAFFGAAAGGRNTTGSHNTVVGVSADVAVGDLSYATAIGSEAFVSTSNTVVLGRSAGEDTVRVPGKLVLGMLGSASSAALCRNASNEISTCSSSLRYKDRISFFSAGLDLIYRLRPVAFDWKTSGEHDLGLIAEEVAEVEPLLVTRNDKGEIEGVKYAQLNVVLINAVKQQQEQIRRQQAEIEQLKQLVCAERPAAAICRAHNR